MTDRRLRGPVSASKSAAPNCKSAPARALPSQERISFAVDKSAGPAASAPNWKRPFPNSPAALNQWPWESASAGRWTGQRGKFVDHTRSKAGRNFPSPRGSPSWLARRRERKTTRTSALSARRCMARAPVLRPCFMSPSAAAWAAGWSERGNLSRRDAWRGGNRPSST